MTIADRLNRIIHNLPEGVRLAAVSKNHSPGEIMEAYQAGQRCFAENKAQELAVKCQELPTDIEWHFIGHLQTNKVKYIAPHVAMIHSVDSLRLLQAINREAEKNGRIIPCLLQFHIAGEDTKFGLSMLEASTLLNSDEYLALQNISIAGVMGMATFTEDWEQVRKEFRNLKNIYDQLKRNFFSGSPGFREISMGMSDDYTIAIEEGSTLVRIGSSIFGARNYA